MKNTKALAQTFLVGLAAAYTFAMLSAAYGPFTGIAKKG